MIPQKRLEELVQLAQQEAELSIADGNGPFGAILVSENGTVIASAHNTQNTDYNASAHAEINLLRIVGQQLKTRHLEDYALVSNAAPCSMCMSAMVKAGVRTYYYGAEPEPTMNPSLSPSDIAEHTAFALELHGGVLSRACSEQIERGRRPQ